MKKKNKVLATSVATIALCASLVAGGTYALFTSESEVNIAVTSGTVDVRATAGALTLYSNNEKQTGNAFANGGTATKVENEISIDRMTPMDSVNFDVKIENYSDVKVQYRTVIKAVDDTGLFEALDVTFTENNESQTFAGGIAYADWATLDAGDNNPNTPEDVSTINVNIEFPNGDNQNVYQGKSCKLAVVVEAVQANADVVNPITYENGIYYVNSEEGMMLMKGIIDSNPHGEGRELNFKLTANMDMTGYDWNVPNAGFTNIDGDNYTVSNLVCGQTERGWSGFLGYFGGGTLKNITLENVTAIGSQAGVIAGHADGGWIENVTIKGANTVAYEENAVEDAPGVGALLGVSTEGLKASSNITIANGATIDVATNDIVTISLCKQYEYSAINDISAYVTKNGTVATTGEWWFGASTAEEIVELYNADCMKIKLTNDVTGDIAIEQKEDTALTIDGADYKYAGVILVDGKSQTYTTAGLTISNLKFVADSISADACIRLGDGTNATRYTCNVTVSNCTFDVNGAVGVKSYTGGDKNLTITGCTATANAHSLVQAKGIDGILVQGCFVYSKNGMNFNNSTNVTVDNCTADVKGYAVRFGESKGGVGAAETYLIKNSNLKSQNDDGDAVIILRGTADYATLTIENTTLTGAPEITNTATDAKIKVDGADYVIVADDTALSVALSSGSSNVSVALGAGNYNMPSAGNKDVVISGTEDTVITVFKPNMTGTEHVTFNGVTIKGSGYSTGVQHANTVTYNNAKIVGEMCLYGEKVVFNNCTFELDAQYVWTYGAKEVEFNTCTFNTTGKAILIYNEGAGASKVTVKGCTFNATAGAKASAIANQNCAAIEIDNYATMAHKLITEGNTYNNEYFSGEWRIKNYVAGAPITVNGAEYTQIAVDGKLMTIDDQKNVTVAD